MTNVFFDTKGGFSTYKKVLDQNEHESRKIRIAHAEEALQRLKQEIDRRMDKLNEILILSEERHALYDYKLAQYEAKPTRALAIELGELRQENEQLDKALEEAHPEGVIAALSEGYRALTEELAQKKALV